VRSDVVNVSIADLVAQHAPLEDELQAAFRRVVGSGRFILGPEVAALEQDLASLHGVKNAVGVSSGTDALLAALMALGVGPGDEVLAPALSFFATAGSIARLGARPVFADVDDDLLLDADDAARRITPRTRAIVTVHLFGRVCEPPRTDLPVIEDAAQAVGAARVGKLGQVACLSFFPTKNLGALGDAGMVLTDDAGLAGRLRALRAHGQSQRYRHEVLGGNFRLDALHAALLRVKLPRLHAWNERRLGHARAYDQLLRGTPLVLPRFRPGDVVHHYVVRAPDRERLREHLAARGVQTEVYYPLPLHRQPATAQDVSLPRAERACAEVLALPVHAELPDGAVEHVAAAIREHYGARG
jgi:dTDP-4-amino-4,6-dideoxygalactose transaminase